MKNRFFLLFTALLCLLCVFTLFACDKDDDVLSSEGGDTPSPEHTHMWGEWSVTTPATCQTDGEETRTCTCGASETQPIPMANAHTYNHKDVCTGCGCSVGTSGLVFTLNSAGTAYSVSGLTNLNARTVADVETLTNGTERNKGDIVIPGYYNDLPILSIDDEAFKDQRDIIRLAFSENSAVTQIGARACANSSLFSVTIPASVESIGREAFKDCEGLIEVYIFSDVDTSETCLTDYAKNVYISQEFKSGLIYGENDFVFLEIEDEAILLVAYLGNDTVLTLPAACNGKEYEIYEPAFIGASDITTLVIPEGSMYFKAVNFPDFPILESIMVEEGNTVYRSEGNCLIEKESDILILGCKNSAIPSGVKHIGPEAFRNCLGLTDINIPTSVKSISCDAFDGCDNLIEVENGVSYVEKWAVGCNNSSVNLILRTDTVGIAGGAFGYCDQLVSITLPATVASIDEYTFFYCTGLKMVEFDANSQLTSIGFSAFESCSSLTSFTIPANVVSIGASAFSMCERLAAITIPASVTSIDRNAFDGCVRLETLEFEANSKLTSIGVSAFECCSSLISVTIPASVTSIDAAAFRECIRLTSITIPASVTSIGDNSFGICIALESIAVDAGNSVYRSEGNCLIEKKSNALMLGCKNSVIPSSVTSIGGYAFSYCELISLVISEGVTSISENAFYYSELTSVVIPVSVINIHKGAFNCCPLESIVVKEGNAVYRSEGDCLILKESNVLMLGCKNSVIPSSVTSIGNDAFYGCDIESSIIIPSSVTSIGKYAFYNCRITTVEFGASSQLESIGEYAFSGCYNLTSITIPVSVTNIGKCAFFHCYALESVVVEEGNSVYCSEGNCLIEKKNNMLILGCKNSVIPSSVTSIGNHAFDNCARLTSITIPSSVTRIGDYAFYNCTELKTIIFEANSQLTSIGSRAFSGCTGLTSVICDATGWWVSKSDIAISTTAAELTVKNLTSTYCWYYWYRTVTN